MVLHGFKDKRFTVGALGVAHLISSWDLVVRHLIVNASENVFEIWEGSLPRRLIWT